MAPRPTPTSLPSLSGFLEILSVSLASSPLLDVYLKLALRVNGVDQDLRQVWRSFQLRSWL